MNKQLLEIYGLSVCFISTACLTIFSGILLYSLVEISFPSIMQEPPSPFLYPPEVTLSKNSEQGTNPFIAKDCIQAPQIKPRIDYAQALAIKSIIRSLIVILVTSLVFFIHWRLAKHARNSSPQN